MKTINKLDKNYCIRVDKETSNQIEKLAQYYQRKPADLLRLVLAPALCDLWAKMEQEQHQENKERPTLARFKK